MSESRLGTESERVVRARAIAQDVFRRRSSGEAVSDDKVFAEHPDIVDQLRIEFKELYRQGSTIANAPTEATGTASSADTPGETTDFHASPGLMSEMSAELRKLRIIAAAREQAAHHAHPASDSVHPGNLFGRYQIITEIARGGMGIVYTARQTDLDRVVCLKVLHAGGTTGDWLVREALLLAKFSHPNIVPIYDAGVIDGRYFYTMEYVEGRTLAQAIDGRPMDPQIVAGVALEIATALAYAHDRGVIHRDIKPRNVLISTPVAGGSMRAEDWHAARVRVADFGLALPVGDSSLGSTLHTAIVGTPLYMSPEQARGERDSLDPRTDVYALGVVLCEMLTGTPPLANLPMKDLLRRVRDEKTPTPLPSSVLPGVDRDLELVCGKAMRKDREERYASAEEMAEDLRRYLAGEKVLAKPDRRAVRRKIKIAAAAAVVLAILAVAAHVIFDPFRLRAPTSIAWSDAASRIGDQLDVKMLGAYSLTRENSLVIDPAPGDPSSFEVIVPTELVSSLPSKLDAQYQQQEMTVHGRIEQENGKPFIRLANSQDLRFERPLTSEERIDSETRFARLHIPRDDKVVNWREASKRIGEDVTVEGNVLSVSESDTSLRANLGFPGRRTVSATIYSEYLPNFGTDIKGAYTGRRVRIAGRLTTRDGKPEIHICLPSQIKVVGLASGEFEENGPAVPFAEAGSHLNELATVEGDVTHVFHSGSACFLNMGGVGPKSPFTAYIPTQCEAEFPNGYESFYSGKRLQVSGEIALFNGKAEMRLEHPYQVRVVGAASVNETPVEFISVEDARDHVGQTRTVQGRVSEVFRGENYAYINFDDTNFKEGFFAHVPTRTLDQMPNGFETYYANREIQVTGEIKLRRGRPVIVVNDKRQIRVVPVNKESKQKGIARDEVPAISPQDAKNHVGQPTTVRGRVETVNKSDKFAFINLEGLNDPKGLAIFVPVSAFASMPSGFQEYYAGRDVHITGVIKLHEGRPEITVTSQQQITVLPAGNDELQQSSKERPSESTKSIQPNDATRFVDQIVTVEAVVKSITRQDRQALVSFEDQPVDGFYLFIPSSAFAQLPSGFEKFYLGKRIHVRGRIKLYKARPQMIVTQASQIQVMHDDPNAAEKPTTEPLPAQAISPQDAGDHVGERATISGRVKSVGKSDKFAYIDLEGIDHQKGLAVYVFASDFASMPSGFEKYYAGRDVRITGRIKLYEGRPQITVTNQQQITVLPRGHDESGQVSKAPTSELVKPIQPIDAVRFVDQNVTVEGLVTGVERQERQAVVLFEGQEKRGGFYLYIPSSAFARLPSGFDQFYRGKRLRVTGRVRLYKAIPSINVTEASQIRVIFDEPAAGEKPATDSPPARKTDQ